MKRFPSVLFSLAVLCTCRMANADSVYIARGDSITFGETNLSNVPSNGDRGYVADFAKKLASRNGGSVPQVMNLAIDGETAASFLTGVERTPPVVGRTDAILAAENTHYSASPTTPQLVTFQSTVGSEIAAGNTITLGFNELGSTCQFAHKPGAGDVAVYFGDLRSELLAAIPEPSSAASWESWHLRVEFVEFGRPASRNGASSLQFK